MKKKDNKWERVKFNLIGDDKYVILEYIDENM